MAKDIVMLSLYADSVPDKNLNFPMMLTEKLDGVMADLYRDATGYHLRTRQNKELFSMQWLEKAMELEGNLEVGEHVIGEMYHDYGLPRVPNFEKISGRLRQTSEQASDIEFFAFDYYKEGEEDTDYADRQMSLVDYLRDRTDMLDIVPPIGVVWNKEEMLAAYNDYMEKHPGVEGVVCRPLNGEVSYYKVGRSKGFLKIVPKPTVDLVIKDIKEATGEQVGQAGKVICEYDGKDISVGLGRITHDIRRDMWDNRVSYLGKTVEVKYKDKTSAGKLRMPVVLRFREDKDD